MEIHHKVKPLHGWREFFGEVGIIVLGVLLALGAEQIAEAIHWHERVETGRAALSRDISGTYVLAAERETYSGCIGRRLAEIAAILDEASRTGRLPPVGDIGSPPHRPWRIATWSGLTASGTIEHFPHEEMSNASAIADYAAIINDMNLAEFPLWSKLYAIVGPGRPFHEAEEAELRSALGEALYRAKLMRLASYQMRQALRTSGIPLDRAALESGITDGMVDARRIAKFPICRPLGKAPAHYGASPLNYSMFGPAGG